MMRHTILLVDDNATFLHHARRFLEQDETLQVVGTAASGPEAVEKARVLQPDLIVLDLSMPGQPGLEALPLLKQAAPLARVIALTLLDAFAYRELTLRRGADDFVSKGRMVEDLLPAIARLWPPGGPGGGTDLPLA